MQLLIQILILVLFLGCSAQSSKNTPEGEAMNIGEIAPGILRDLFGQLNYDYGQAYFEMADIIVSALDEKNKESLKQLFALKVINENTDLDKQIDALFLLYKGPKESINWRITPSSSEHPSLSKTNKYGQKEIALGSGFIITTAQAKYYVYLDIQSRNDFDKNEEGLRTLKFAGEDAFNGKYFWFQPKDGIYILTSPEKPGDIMRVYWGGSARNLFYTFIDRTLTEEDFLSAVIKDDDFDNVCNAVGEPNAVINSENFSGGYCFELENKLAVVCKVAYSKIKYMYVSDEEQELYPLWLAEDIIKIGGGYYPYRPADGRNLPEDFFTSFPLGSTSVETLIKEIGPPDAEDGSFCYWYELPDKRFVQIYHTGDSIRKISIAGESGYTLWNEKQ
jgi:hypothetical protein